MKQKALVKFLVIVLILIIMKLLKNGMGLILSIKPLKEKHLNFVMNINVQIADKHVLNVKMANNV